MLKSIRSLSLTALAMLTWSLPVLAQSAPPPAASDSDDLEVPASPATVPRAAADKPLPAAAPAPKPVTPAPVAAESKSDDSELRREVAELRARLEAVEQARAAAPSASPSANPRKLPAPVSTDLEANGTLRPVPKGFQIGGYLQTQFESNQASSDQLQTGGIPYNQDRFSLRRGRLSVDYGWEYANANLELDANTTRGMSVGIRRDDGSLL